MMNLFRRLFNVAKEPDTAVPAEPITVPTEPPETVADSIPPAPVKPDEAPAAPTPIVLDSVFVDGATRPLSEETLIAFMGNGHIIFGQASDVGMVRSNNQDAIYSFFSTLRSSEERPDFGLFIVADGMGGHHDGEKASAITVRTVALEVTKTLFAPMLAGETQDQPPIAEYQV
jgi:hypothetical protein